MSLLPPTPIVLSKMKFYLKSNLPPSLLEQVNATLPPYPVFTLRSRFRSLSPQQQDIEFTDYDDTTWDDIDVVLNAYTKMKNEHKERLQTSLRHAGVLDIKILTRPENETAWTDMFMDSVPIFPNAVMVKTEDGKTKFIDPEEKKEF